MKRLVHVVRSDSFAGVERYLTTVAPAQAEAGWDVTVIGGAAEVMPAALGPNVNWLPATSTLDAVQAMRRFGRAELVHAHMTAAELASVVSWPAHRAPVVATRHFAGERGSTIGARMAGVFIRHRLAAQVAISSFVAASTREPTTVILNPVQDRDTERHPEPIVVCVQRLEPEKDTATALRAWAASALPTAGWRLVLAGRGSQHQMLDQLAHDLGIATSVELVGFVADPSDLLSRAACLLATATAEPFGLAVAEAAASGTPVVATRSGAHPEVLGSSAYLFEPGDAAGCASLLDSVRQAPEAAELHGAQLQRRQRSLLSVATHVAALDRIYDRVL